MTPPINYSIYFSFANSKENVAGMAGTCTGKFEILSIISYYGKWNSAAWEERVLRFNCLPIWTWPYINYLRVGMRAARKFHQKREDAFWVKHFRATTFRQTKNRFSADSQDFPMTFHREDFRQLASTRAAENYSISSLFLDAWRSQRFPKRLFRLAHSASSLVFSISISSTLHAHLLATIDTCSDPFYRTHGFRLTHNLRHSACQKSSCLSMSSEISPRRADLK